MHFEEDRETEITLFFTPKSTVLGPLAFEAFLAADGHVTTQLPFYPTVTVLGRLQPANVTLLPDTPIPAEAVGRGGFHAFSG